MEEADFALQKMDTELPLEIQKPIVSVKEWSSADHDAILNAAGNQLSPFQEKPEPDQGLVGQFNDSLTEFVIQSLQAFPGKKEVWAVGERVHYTTISQYLIMDDVVKEWCNFTFRARLRVQLQRNAN